MRLRRSDVTGAGLTLRRSGRGFRYLTADGDRSTRRIWNAARRW